jgi:hypothetical protein
MRVKNGEEESFYLYPERRFFDKNREISKNVYIFAT